MAIIMSIYDREKKRNPRNFRVSVDAIIDPCANCILKDERPHEDCLDCPVNPDKKKKDHISNSTVNSIVTFV